MGSVKNWRLLGELVAIAWDWACQDSNFGATEGRRPGVEDMGSNKKRRASGTRTMLDVLLRWSWIRRRTPEGDIEDFGNGQTIEVVAMTKSLGAPRLGVKVKGQRLHMPKQGLLSLTAGSAPVWQDRRSKETVTVSVPCALVGDGKKIPPRFAEFELETGEGTHQLIIPRADVAFVRFALAEISRADSDCHQPETA
jgi:hypothetical protein